MSLCRAANATQNFFQDRVATEEQEKAWRCAAALLALLIMTFVQVDVNNLQSSL